MPVRSTLPRAAAVGTAAALVLVAGTYGLAALSAGDLVATPPGRPATTVTLPVALFATVVGGLLALAGAALARRTPRPRAVFLGLAGVGLVGSFASPLGAADTAATAFWLSAMHVAVAAGAVPPLARALPTTRPTAPAAPPAPAAPTDRTAHTAAPADRTVKAAAPADRAARTAAPSDQAAHAAAPADRTVHAPAPADQAAEGSRTRAAAPGDQAAEGSRTQAAEGSRTQAAAPADGTAR